MESELKAIEKIVNASSEFMVIYGFQVLGAIIPTRRVLHRG